jgi:anti-sigma factor RsiW
MNCKSVSGLFSGYVDGELKAHEALLVRQHLNVCESCAAEVNMLKHLKAFIANDVRDIQIPAGLEDRLKKAIPVPVYRTPFAFAAVAVSALAIVSVLLLSRPPSTSDVESKRVMVMSQKIEADQMAFEGADSMSGASLVHYANNPSR